MSRDSQRYRKTYSYYRVQPKTELLEVIVDETLDWKNSVRAASTGTVSLTGVGTTLSFGGITIVDEDRVLLKDQSTSSQNGIYYFEVSGGNYALTRASDARQGTLSSGATVYVEEGTNAGKLYILSTTGAITVDTTSLTWTEFSGGGGGGGSAEYAQFYTVSQQYAAVSATAYEIDWQTKAFGSAGITCPGTVGSPDPDITISTAGKYSVKVRTHGVQTYGGSLVLYLWCYLNGADVDGTMTVWQIPYATVPNRQCVSTEWFLDIPAGGVLQIRWATDNTALSLAQQNFSGVTSRAVVIELNKVS